MIHVLLTPPSAKGVSTLENLGILEVDGLPDFALDIFGQMVEEKWIVTLVMEPIVSWPKDHHLRLRGLDYVGQWMIDHEMIEDILLKET